MHQQTPEPDSPTKSSRWKWTLITLAILAGIIVPFLLFGEQIDNWTKQLIESPAGRTPAAALILGGLLGSDILLPVPSSIVSTACGVLFGFQLGTLISLAGMVISCLIGYGLAARFGEPFVEKMVGKKSMRRFIDIQKRCGNMVVIITRPVPVLAEIGVLFAGLGRIPFKRFFLLSTLSNLGISMVYAAIGAFSTSTNDFFLAVAGSMLLPGIAMLWFYRGSDRDSDILQVPEPQNSETPPIYITSDLHLGLKQCKKNLFIDFLQQLPDNAILILNGDTVTHFYSDETLSDEHKEVIAALRRESFQREIIWIRGNNDGKLNLSDPGNIRYARDCAIAKRLYITHGDRFDWIMPSTRVILIPIRVIYYSLAKLRGSNKHVAEYAKRFSGLYAVLCRHVASNAARYAKRHGYQAVTCGHTHYTEDRQISGIRYLNTGCWTEDDTAVVIVDNQNISLHSAEALAKNKST
jgi:uncharacterized membrane protein YdjX (TVP38/TMEM64 family)/UDP-2,3-diacylglucosamine pyrophosphatase LpxH